MKIKLNLDTSNTYVLAVSGGLDSMVLFDLFLKYKHKIVVVHFNHQKRSESVYDNELIEKLCKNHNVPYHYIKLNIKKGNFQDSARQLRYQFLEDIATLYRTPYIVTAHHLDDLAETIIMKLIRGSNLLGYSGMQKLTKIDEFVYLKPLLDYSKNDLETYKNTFNISFLEDSSNLEDDYLRNRIRHHIIPILKEENNILSHFKNFSNQAYLASDFIRSESLKFLPTNLNFSLQKFLELHLSIQYDVISLILEKVDAKRSNTKIEMILKQLNSTKPNIDITLSNNHHMIKSYDRVYIINISDEFYKDKPNHLMISHNKVGLPKKYIELCYNKLNFPIQIRKRLPGDKLQFKFGTKKLKDFLIDKKIPKKSRDDLDIIVDSNQTVLWIPGIYKNETLGSNNIIYLWIKE
ncbi:tRNA lysidine(34) synthetase TilS [Acholeplasma granularum]|uniref:tRNA lysidine(34) synthetase TilS n=1 Tax=Acholeplasma granularum TaxID=264635 RepID=UPI00046F0BCD|nr:tRNA lysidine(34) synthetase TilS [Acholeplasma granularum]